MVGSLRKLVSASLKSLTTRPSTARATNLAFTRRTACSVQTSGARPARGALQHSPRGGPPEPLQTKIGLPSAAALVRASHTLVNQGTCWNSDSPGCGLIVLWSLSKSASVSPLTGGALATTRFARFGGFLARAWEGESGPSTTRPAGSPPPPRRRPTGINHNLTTHFLP